MKIDSTTLLLGVVGIAAVYLMTKPATVTPTYMPTTVASTPVYSAGSPYASPTNTVAQDINAGGSALNSIANLIGDF
jgi:hypothetical protein